ncbi:MULTISPECIES: DUF6082 family protein [unclassified Streptomyces]|uniref:DUF6082 family protein n=1 Tax=unclassified Streptomyces TaxID=2593676 RepID=UPI00070EE595|nr:MULTISPECIES: DUF6082 family protein [unclassified Streptomyces]KRD22636.1 hypothetical protein ASE41_11930 [Streptomyces sp. Root264]
MATQKSRARGLVPVAAAGLGLAAGALAALAAQRHTLDALRVRLEHLETAARDQRHTNLAHQQRLHWELLSKAIDSPELAEVLDIFEAPASAQQRRQYLFANALYTNLLFYYRIGNLSREEFHGRMRGLLQNPVVRGYWYATQGQRATLPDDSDEAGLGRMVDELLRRLEEADIDEWWVVGEPPVD